LRSETVTDVVSHLEAGAHVNLIGMPGSGRSSLLAEIKHELDAQGWRVFELAGVTAFRERPLVPLALAGVNMAGGPVSTANIASSTDALAESIGRPSTVLIVDDADDLDDTSAGVVIAAERRKATPILTTTRPGRRSASSVELWSPSGSGVRIELRAMRYDSVCALVLGVLPGAVDPATMVRIATTSGGLPGLVVALAETGRKNGRLVQRDGVWSAGPDLWAPELSQAVAPILAGLDKEEIEALRTVALATAMPVDDAVKVLPWELLDGLEDSGLLHVMGAGDDSMIGIYPPLVADYFRHETRSIRRYHVAESLASVVRPEADGRPLLVPPPAAAEDDAPESETVRSQFLKGHGAAEVAARRTAWTRDPRPRTAVPYIISLHNHGADPALITEVVERTPTCPSEESDTAVLQIWRACYTAIAGKDLRSALSILRRGRDEQSAVDGLMRATEAHLQLILERLPDSDLMRPAAATEMPLSHEAQAVLVAEALVAKGQCAAASEQLGRVRIEFSPYLLRADIVQELSLVLRGEVNQALTVSAEKLRTARVSLDAAAIAGHSYVIALGLLLTGRMDELEHHLDATLALVEAPMMQWHFQVGSLVVAALLAAARGRRSYALSLMMQARTHGHRPGPFPGMVPDDIIEPLRTDEPADNQDLWAGIRDRLERGYLAQAILHSIWAAERQPDSAAARQLRQAAETSDSRPLQLVADYAVAIAEADPSALTAVGDSLFDVGYAAVGVRAHLAAIRLRRAQGDVTGGAQAAEVLWKKSGVLGIDLGVVSAALARDIDLTRRELEIARLASTGRSNQSIAGQLSLSVRTVENHLLSVYRKVGVENRDGLTRVMSAWLSSA
jgi:DNA-binding CsgD family transcriptional regulator